MKPFTSYQLNLFGLWTLYRAMECKNLEAICRELLIESLIETGHLKAPIKVKGAA